MRDWFALGLLRLIGSLGIILGRIIPRDVGPDGKDKRTGSRVVYAETRLHHVDLQGQILAEDGGYEYLRLDHGTDAPADR